MRICLLSSANSVHTQRWAKSLHDYGHDVMVISLYDGHIENAENARTSKAFYPKYHFAIKKVLQRFRPDILHAHHASSYGFLGALQNFHPYIVSVWGYDVLLFPYKSIFHRQIIKHALRKADQITATSKALSKAVFSLAGLSAEVIPFGVDKGFIETNRNYDNEKLVIGIVKDLRSVYGIDVLIKAFAGLVMKGYPVKLMIVGEGELKSDLINLCNQLNINEYVSFKNKVPHSKVIDLFKEIDIFAIPSHSESFGVAAVEAMATGLPVVASNIGGLPEVVDDGKTGMLVKPGDVEDLKRALEFYILDKDARIEHGKRGREKVEALYNWKDNAEQMNNLYKEILSKTKS